MEEDARSSARGEEGQITLDEERERDRETGGHDFRID